MCVCVCFSLALSLVCSPSLPFSLIRGPVGSWISLMVQVCRPLSRGLLLLLGHRARARGALAVANVNGISF